MSLAPSCHDAVWQASRSALYVLDADTLRIRDANPAARRLVPFAPDAAFTELAPALPREQFDAALATGAIVSAVLVDADGMPCPVALRLAHVGHEGRACVLAIAEDETPAAALQDVQARFDAIVSHTPGLVYQFRREPDGGVSFPYLSEGCLALLGLHAAELATHPERFAALVLPDDRQSYLDSMASSATTLWSWNWEGRIWIEAWKDVKWINLRATPHVLPGGAVQWEGIMTNITESKQEQLEVRASRARLAELTAHIEKVKEQERTRMAREIHDDLGGNLTAIKMALAMLAARLPEGDAVLAEKAAYVDELADRTIDAVHRITLDLRPSILDFGLVAALEWQVKEFAAQAGLACSFQSNEKDVELDPDQATALFRIVQEALTNIAKHANASRVTVRLHCTRTQVSVKVTDNGRGIRASDRNKAGSFGLRGMAERARALGGTLTLSDAPEGGTVVAIGIRRLSPLAKGLQSRNTVAIRK
ncbi:histidine kinase/DNA gyrase B/HSP90-like ATPase [Pseudoduganella lurida]|uniref:Histidine kinase/DNA gyrase B/HSP90-like ATPase n=1 Tax=Pseudoduganella lurida TaxID=1036180 RepID=A0A562QZ72_9BURK|nr:sensor histidine kinase [Pseudoduganella lurida]TWI62077.1 histidine kinase/DNA gyrase B/HSP90-like ATPase [Pseudoduganella lurida]